MSPVTMSPVTMSPVTMNPATMGTNTAITAAGRAAAARALLLVVVLILLSATTATASRIAVDVSLAQPWLEAGEQRTTYLKVGLTGFELAGRRTPVNLAIVLDRSGSMQGDKLRHAKEAALLAVKRLAAEDIVSVIAYDHSIHVVVPATRVADREHINTAIRQLEAGGNTALFAGVSKGAFEVRKFLDPRKVNRVLLLSDGLANVGPDTPADLGELGASLRKEGISITTVGLGLGYNEDLMTRLAERSDGNHAFAEQPTDLARIFDLELGDVLEVVAQEVLVEITCPPGVRPVRVLGRDAEIVGRKVLVLMNQLYSKHEKYVLLELEVPAQRAGEELQVAGVEVSYANMATMADDHLNRRVAARFTDSVEVVQEHENRDVMVAVVEQIATLQNELALNLRDQGKIEEAQQLLLLNADYAAQNAVVLNAKQLQELALDNFTDADNLAPEDWEKNRKVMRERQSVTKTQRRY